MGREKTATIVGGGIIGVTSAYALARRGWCVTILEAEPKIARGASWGNGRQLSYSHTNALASPQLLSQIPRLLLGANDAFRLSLRSDRHFFGWLACFLTQCRPAAFRRNTLAALALARRSQLAMEHLLLRQELDFGHARSGKLVILDGPEDVEAAKAILHAKQQAGLDQDLLDREQALAIEPALAQMPGGFSGALHAPGDDSGDCNAFAEALFELTRSEWGATFHGSERVLSVTRQNGESIVKCESGKELRSDLTVVASGHSANDILKPLGHRLPIEPMKGYSFTAPLGAAPPKVSVTDNARRIVFTHLGDRMLVAGIAEMGRVDGAVEPERVLQMKHAARTAMPQAADYEAADDGWAGLRPMTPNSLPITRMLAPGLAVNAGHGMLGWTMAMGSAEELAEAVGQAF